MNTQRRHWGIIRELLLAATLKDASHLIGCYSCNEGSIDYISTPDTRQIINQLFGFETEQRQYPWKEIKNKLSRDPVLVNFNYDLVFEKKLIFEEEIDQFCSEGQYDDGYLYDVENVTEIKHPDGSIQYKYQESRLKLSWLGCNVLDALNYLFERNPASLENALIDIEEPKWIRQILYDIKE